MEQVRTIFYFEDDEAIARTIKEFLESPPKRVSDPKLKVSHHGLAANAIKAINEWANPEIPALGLLDLHQANYTQAGLDISRKIKESWDIPVIFLSDYPSTENQLAGIDGGGAQQFLSKAKLDEPGNMELLRSIIIANLPNFPDPAPEIYKSGSLKIDMEVSEASWKGKKLDLNDTDLGILDELARPENMGKLCRYSQLLSAGGMKTPRDLDRDKIGGNVRTRIKLIRRAFNEVDADFIDACMEKRYGIINYPKRGYRWLPDTSEE